jgi:hypothetical protein
MELPDRPHGNNDLRLDELANDILDEGKAGCVPDDLNLEQYRRIVDFQLIDSLLAQLYRPNPEHLKGCVDRLIRTIKSGDDEEVAEPTVFTPIGHVFGYLWESRMFSSIMTGFIMFVCVALGVRWNLFDYRPAEIQTVVEPKRVFVGEITNMSHCRWIPRSQRPVLFDRVCIGRRFELESGSLELAYDSGAKVILQGPLTYEVNSNNSGYLFVGRVTGRIVNKTAKGFTIHTPTGNIVDLGTEFAAEVAPSGKVDATVFFGQVKLVTNASARHQDGMEKVLNAGQAARIVDASARRDDAGKKTPEAGKGDDAQTAEGDGPTIESLAAVPADRFIRSMPAVPVTVLMDSITCNGSFEGPAVGLNALSPEDVNAGANPQTRFWDVVPWYWDPVPGVGIAAQSTDSPVRGISGKQYAVLRGGFTILSTKFDAKPSHPPALRFQPHMTYIITADFSGNVRGAQASVAFDDGRHSVGHAFSVAESDAMAPMPALALDTDEHPEFVGNHIGFRFMKSEPGVGPGVPAGSSAQVYIDNVQLRVIPSGSK